MIGILSGSSRKNSNTHKVALAIKRICTQNGIAENVIHLPDFTEYDFPFMNGTFSKNHLSKFQESVTNAMQQSKLIFVLSPEYNWFPSAEIINVLNHLGGKDFSTCFNNKIFCTVGISSGRGGRIPAVQLSYVINKLINVLDLESIVSAKMFESQFTPQVLDADGNSLGNEEYDKGIEKFVHYNLNLVKRF